MTREWLSTTQAAEILGLTRREVAAAIDEADLVAYPQMTSGGTIHRWRIDPDSVNSYHERMVKRHAASKRRVRTLGRWAA